MVFLAKPELYGIVTLAWLRGDVAWYRTNARQCSARMASSARLSDDS